MDLFQTIPPPHSKSVEKIEWKSAAISPSLESGLCVVGFWVRSFRSMQF